MTRTARPRYRDRRRHSPRLARWLAAQSARWSGEETPIEVHAVDGVLELDGPPDALGPYTLRGAPPPELRRLERIWLKADENDDATVFGRRSDIGAGRSTPLAAWPLELAVDASETPAAITAVSAENNTLTVAGHGFAVGDGPFYVATDDALPGGLSAATNYWIATVPSEDTFTLAEEPGGDVVDIASAGTGNHTIALLNVDTDADAIRYVGHGMQTGDGPVELASDGALPTGLSDSADYYVIRRSADWVAFATSRENALAGTAVNITAIGSGEHALARPLFVGKDFSPGGLLEWMAQGVPREVIRDGAVEDVDTIFAGGV